MTLNDVEAKIRMVDLKLGSYLFSESEESGLRKERARLEGVKVVLDAFVAVLERPVKNHGLVRLNLLSEEGWTEMIPEPGCWIFTHEDYPDVMIRWHVFEDRVEVKSCLT